MGEALSDCVLFRSRPLLGDGQVPHSNRSYANEMPRLFKIEQGALQLRGQGSPTASARRPLELHVAGRLVLTDPFEAGMPQDVVAGPV